MTNQRPALPVEWLWQPPAIDQGQVIILAHGAGAAMDTPFLDHFAQGFATLGWGVVRFEFPYMAARREDPPRRRPPDRQPTLLARWEQVIASVRQVCAPRWLVLAGKSMGGRMASLIADDQAADGLIALGYPFHPAGKPEKCAERVAHLRQIRTPMLICQGTRDALGGRETAEGLTLSPAVSWCWLEDGDHSFKPRRSSGRSEPQAWQEALDQCDEFLGLISR